MAGFLLSNAISNKILFCLKNKAKKRLFTRQAKQYMPIVQPQLLLENILMSPNCAS